MTLYNLNCLTIVIIAHLFLIEIRIRFKKTPVLTMTQTYRLVGAALTRAPAQMRIALSELMYHLKRNFVAYKSHRKTKMKLLA
jgi:hypothetical protein